MSLSLYSPGHRHNAYSPHDLIEVAGATHRPDLKTCRIKLNKHTRQNHPISYFWPKLALQNSEAEFKKICMPCNSHDKNTILVI